MLYCVLCQNSKPLIRFDWFKLVRNRTQLLSPTIIDGIEQNFWPKSESLFQGTNQLLLTMYPLHKIRIHALGKSFYFKIKWTLIRCKSIQHIFYLRNFVHAGTIHCYTQYSAYQTQSNSFHHDLVSNLWQLYSLSHSSPFPRYQISILQRISPLQHIPIGRKRTQQK